VPGVSAEAPPLTAQFFFGCAWADSSFHPPRIVVALQSVVTQRTSFRHASAWRQIFCAPVLDRVRLMRHQPE